jgi:hypothetical protein
MVQLRWLFVDAGPLKLPVIAAVRSGREELANTM